MQKKILEVDKLEKFENNVQYVKYLINREVASRYLQGTLHKGEKRLREMAEEILPGSRPSFRCCIYKERYIAEERMRFILELGEMIRLFMC